MKHKYKVRFFTLLELLVSMGVFAILMLALMHFFTSAQSIWLHYGAKDDAGGNVRIAMELLKNDLQNLYYESGHATTKSFFYLPATNTDEFWIMGFVTERGSEIAPDATSSLVMVYYKYDQSKGLFQAKVVSDVDLTNSADWITGKNFTSNTWNTYNTTEKWLTLAENVVSFSRPLFFCLPLTSGSSGSLKIAPATIPYRILFKFAVINEEAKQRLQAMDPTMTYAKMYEVSQKELGTSAVSDIAKLGIQSFSLAITIER